MLVKCLPKFAIALFIVLLGSCASFKPNNYDKQSRVFSNYKMNYSVKIPENYSFVEKEDNNIDSFSKQLFSKLGGNVDAIMSYKHYPIIFTFYAKKATVSGGFKRSLDKSFKEKNSISELMSNLSNQDTIKESLKVELESLLKKENIKPTSIHISSQGEYLIFSIITETQLLDLHLNAAITYFKQNQNSNEYYSFNAVSIYFPSATSIAHEDLSKFIKKVKLRTFLQKDRYKNN